ncbi:hypothetical protein CK203_082032 [Vitis vinifera]|uniref:Uncharacterized protein n=1 Tax=Vitis vinifera TaxID=29760 RepID=A0A438BWC5_VITVI|nr:hypothetical protein CK203_082032 [Vitis vinifera]
MSPFLRSFSRRHGKIAEIIDRPSEKDQIQMVLRSLQPRIARHVVEGRNHPDDRDRLMTHSSYAPQQYRSRAPHQTYDQAYMPRTLVLPYFATQGTERPHVSYSATGHPCYMTQFAARPTTSYPKPRA